MLIIGAKGFAKEVLEVVHQNGEDESLCFYDDISQEIPEKLYGRYNVLKSESEAKSYFENVDNKFVMGVGHPKLRHHLFKKFVNLGGVFTSTISRFSEIGSFGVSIKNGCNVLGGVKISNDVSIGVGGILYYNSVITHDVQIDDFVEVSPGVTILGRCKIGAFTQIGAGAIIFPDVIIGKNVIIGAGAVVRENIVDGCKVVGVPARVIN